MDKGITLNIERKPDRLHVTIKLEDGRAMSFTEPLGGAFAVTFMDMLNAMQQREGLRRELMETIYGVRPGSSERKDQEV